MRGMKQHGPLERLKTEVSDTLDPAYDRAKHIRNFLQGLRFGGITVNDWEAAVGRMSSGSAFEKADVLPSAGELLSALSESEKPQLREHYFANLRTVVKEFPNLKNEFREQFRGFDFAV